MRPAAQAAQEDKNADFTPLALFAFFVNRCRENLHIIIAFSPIGDTFRNRMRQFPSLINCCTIDWFQVRCTEIVIMLIDKAQIISWLTAVPVRSFNCMSEE